MNILIIGSGGREHAIAWKLKSEKEVNKIYCAPGNAGISEIAQCVDIQVEDIAGLLDFSKSNDIDLTIVGPEVPLVLGIVDEFEKQGMRIFGPNKDCARLEGSKGFAKDFMIRHGIATAKYEEFTEFKAAKESIGDFGYPVVIKADGLAAGKGVIIAQNLSEAQTALEDILLKNKFGKNNSVVIEEFLEGVEASLLAFVDGETIVPMESAKDHKKIFDGEKGENTGGMGTYSPSPLFTNEFKDTLKAEILDKIMLGFKKDGLNFKGILFIGLMITKDGIKVLEFNTRFGDPETQSVLPRLETDLSEIMLKTIDGDLKNMDIKWKSESCTTVILASGGYPNEYEKGKVISGLTDVGEGIMVFHSGTKLSGKSVVTNGGRVLGITSLGEDLASASDKVYEAIPKISFDNMHYRTDIGRI